MFGLSSRMTIVAWLFGLDAEVGPYVTEVARFLKWNVDGSDSLYTPKKKKTRSTIGLSIINISFDDPSSERDVLVVRMEDLWNPTELAQARAIVWRHTYHKVTINGDIKWYLKFKDASGWLRSGNNGSNAGNGRQRPLPLDVGFIETFWDTLPGSPIAELARSPRLTDELFIKTEYNRPPEVATNHGAARQSRRYKACFYHPSLPLSPLLSPLSVDLSLFRFFCLPVRSRYLRRGYMFIR